MCKLGSFEALIDHHNAVQKETGINLARVNAVLSNDPEISKIRGIVENSSVIDVAPEFCAIHRTAPFCNLQLRMLRWLKCMPKIKCCYFTWKIYHL